MRNYMHVCGKLLGACIKFWVHVCGAVGCMYAVVGCKVYGDVWVHVYAFWVYVYGSVGCMYAVVGCKVCGYVWVHA